MNAAWKRPLTCAGTDDWSERSGRNILRSEDRRIRKMFPEFRLVVLLPGQAIWEGPLQPFAQPYRVRLIWRLSVSGPQIRWSYASPKVLVLEPTLVRRESEPMIRIPHLYREPAPQIPAHLCLYWPDGREFNDAMYLAESVLPWAAEWLGYYELWHATGKWFGPEAPHSSNPVEQPPSSPEGRARAPAFLRKPKDGSVLSAHPYLVSARHPLSERP